MVVTRSADNSMTDGPLSTLRKNDISQTEARRLDGLEKGPAQERSDAPIAKDEAGEEVIRPAADDENQENDIDPETLHNTQVNECMTPKRMLRRRASSKLNSNSPDTSSLEDSPPKHVEFVGEPHPTHVLENHKATLHNTKAPEERKEHAREVLEFHGEPCN